MLKFRKFAAQISCSQRHCPEETKKLKPSIPSSNEFGDCIFIDVDENKASVDQPVPMFLEETETRFNEADEMVSTSCSLPLFNSLECFLCRQFH